jgi:hypothetical protein
MLNWISKTFWGVDLDEEQRRSDAADAAKDVQDRYLLDTGVWAQSQYDEAQRNKLSDTSAYGQNVKADVNSAFAQGWKEGAQNVSSTISGAFNRIIADPLRAVVFGLPWWLWLAALLFVFGYFGGFRWLKTKLKLA